jgi:D-arabinose 1-dehydrogenase-like Zn-dependent alcohol dehydrogenase
MRVALPWLGYACGVCRYCNSGRETLCPHQLNTGDALDGSFAEYALGYARHVVARRAPPGRLAMPGRARSTGLPDAAAT